ncbi:hypothetical protein [Spirosoma koreense]
MAYTTHELNTDLRRVHVLMDSPLFERGSSEMAPWRPAFIDLIRLLHGILAQAQELNKRVDFMDNVGINGKIQDITSLVDWLNEHLPTVTTDQPGQLAANRLNRYFDQGTGYFSNGCFFTVGFDDELAFFLDDQRIYLNRHIRRAIDIVEKLALSENRPTA